MIKVYDTGNGILEYISGKNGIEIISCKDAYGVLNIPPDIDGQNIIVIGKKAFFNQKGISELFIPEPVEEIEGWAFSSCENLRKIYIPIKAKNIKNDTFLKTEKLERIYLYSGNSVCIDDIAALLAVSVTVIRDYSMIRNYDEKNISDWCSEWDNTAFKMMNKNDLDGFTPFPAGGEEDYVANDNNENYHCRKKRLEKVRTAFLRLIHDFCLKDEYRVKYEKYLLEHNIGCTSEETWEYVVNEEGITNELYKKFAEIGGITGENIEALISSLGGEHTELKAFLLRKKQENMGETDFFDNLFI